MVRKGALLLAVLVAFALSAVTIPSLTAAQNDEVAVRAEARRENRENQDVIRVDVSVEHVSNLGAFGFVLLFDDSKLDILDDAFERGPFLGSTGREVYCDEPTVTDGAARYACVTLGSEPEEGPSGDGKLASVYFEPSGDGNAVFQLTRVQLAEPRGDNIPVTVAGGEISVQSDGGFPWWIVGIAGLVAVVAVVGIVALVLRSRSSRTARVEMTGLS